MLHGWFKVCAILNVFASCHASLILVESHSEEFKAIFIVDHGILQWLQLFFYVFYLTALIKQALNGAMFVRTLQHI